eukprot:11328408-Alexandrium_andersonii.AAC.1
MRELDAPFTLVVSGAKKKAGIAAQNGVLLEKGSWMAVKVRGPGGEPSLKDMLLVPLRQSLT